MTPPSKSPAAPARPYSVTQADARADALTLMRQAGHALRSAEEAERDDARELALRYRAEAARLLTWAAGVVAAGPEVGK